MTTYGSAATTSSPNSFFVNLCFFRYTTSIGITNRLASATGGSHSGRDEDKFAAAGLTLATRHNIPYVDEGNFVLLCEKMSATRITEDSFLLPEIKEKWYKDGDMHTMYVAEIIDILAR